MKKVYLLTALAILSVSIFSQEISEEAIVINVEVPVRVFKGSRFIDNLTINDFQIFEEGIPQKIEAVYLVKKKSIERREENKRFSPEISRNFYLFFEVSEYSPKLGKAISYFIHNKIIPGDNLIIVTPLSTYRLTPRALEVKTKEELARELKDIVRRDATVGYSEYRSAIKELIALAQALSSDDSIDTGSFIQADEFTSAEHDIPLDKKIMRYSTILRRIEGLRKVDQQKFLDFAGYLRNVEGQKYVFLFYQREFIPHIEQRILDQYMTVYQDMPEITRGLSELFNFFRRDILFDIDPIKQAYADSSISIHFLFITTPPIHVQGIRFKEQSEDIYNAFKEMSAATGGHVESSANPEYLFRQSVEASENYYLLYYSPQNYKNDGKFKKIDVNVENKSYKVTHRYGYFAH